LCFQAAFLEGRAQPFALAVQKEEHMESKSDPLRCSSFLLAGLATNVIDTGSVCDQKTSKFFVPRVRKHGRTRGCKWNVLKVSEEKNKGKHGGTQVEAGS
jgi:hypothetical protein